MGKDRSGAGGKDLVIKVPVGTQILDEDKETVLADLTQPGQRVVLAQGRRRRPRQRAVQDPRPTARRAAPTRAGRARSAGSGCG